MVPVSLFRESSAHDPFLRLGTGIFPVAANEFVGTMTWEGCFFWGKTPLRVGVWVPDPNFAFCYPSKDAGSLWLGYMFTAAFGL